MHPAASSDIETRMLHRLRAHWRLAASWLSQKDDTEGFCKTGGGKPSDKSQPNYEQCAGCGCLLGRPHH